MLKIISVFIFFFGVVTTMMDPAQIIGHLEKIKSEELAILTMDLGRTINGRTIMGYGITKIKELKQNPQLYREVPSVLLTSYMHSRDQHSVDLLLSYITSAILNFPKDFYLNFVLDNGMVWFVPFINIDAYEEFVRTGKVAEMESGQWQKFLKNRHLYPKSSHTKLCEKQYLNGVQINKNFMAPPQNELDPCDPKYPGPSPFSEGESKAIKKIYEKLNISVAIDIQAKGNKWIYPYSDDQQHQQLNNHPLAYLYQDITSRLKKAGYSVGNKHELGQETGDGYLEWAANQGKTLAFSHLVGYEYSMQKQETQQVFQNSFPVIDMLVKKICPIYEKYRGTSTFGIQSLSVQEFQLETEIKIPSGRYSKKKSFIMRPGQSIMIQFDAYTREHISEAELKLLISDTPLGETIKILDLDINEQAISTLMNQISESNKKERTPANWYRWVNMGIFVLCLGRIAYYLYTTVIAEKMKSKKDQEEDRLIS